MGLQKFRADTSRICANGAVEWSAEWMGGRTLAKVANCPCDDGKRRTVYATGEADTHFSIPAACIIRGKRAVGYITGTEGGTQFRFMNNAIEAHGLSRVALDEITGNPVAA